MPVIRQGIRFSGSHRYLKSFTFDKSGDVDDITTTIKQNEAMHLDINEACEFKKIINK